MRRKIVLTVLLCLATTAALAIGAAPALAASGCTCHTAVPPTGGAPAAHAPLVVGVDCTTCHVGWTVPHPTAVAPTLTATNAKAGGLDFSMHVKGALSIPWVPLGGIIVYVQMLRPDATEYTDVGQGTTTWRGFFEVEDVGDGTMRCISQGAAGSPVVLPSLSVAPVDLPTPTITFRLSGPKAGIVRLGQRVTATGRVRPLALAGQTVIIQYMGWRAGKTTEHALVKRTISATGTYIWTFKPHYRGVYHLRARVPRTAAYNYAGAPTHYGFRVE